MALTPILTKATAFAIGDPQHAQHTSYSGAPCTRSDQTTPLSALERQAIPTLRPFKDTWNRRYFSYRGHKCALIMVHAHVEPWVQFTHLWCGGEQVDLDWECPLADVLRTAVETNNFGTPEFKLAVAALLDRHIDALEGGV